MPLRRHDEWKLDTPSYGAVPSRRRAILKGTAMSARKDNLLRPLLAGLLFLLACQGSACAEEIYRHKRIWPILQQPWYFNEPVAVAVDQKGQVYIADYRNHRIQKFSSEGQFIKKWGTDGTDDGHFTDLDGVAVDSSGNVYVLDQGHRIQKFTDDGQYIKKWGSQGFDDGQFNYAKGIAVDGGNNVYVADSGNHRIQKFTSDGQFIAKWGSEGVNDGEFDTPLGLAFDDRGKVYVLDSGNYCVQRFTTEGKFLKKWAHYGWDKAELTRPEGIAVDSAENVYVLDAQHVKKFTSNGKFIKKWGKDNLQNGGLGFPSGIAVDFANNIYVTDTLYYPVQKFSSNGGFLAKWNSYGNDKGHFTAPTGIARDASGNVYVADSANHRIQKFTADGQFLKKWGSRGEGDGQFNTPEGIAIDSLGNIYVADSANHRIQKFTADGQFLKKWGSLGGGEGQFRSPQGLALDSMDNVYIADTSNDRIQKFTADGQFIAMWRSAGSEDSMATWPYGVAIDANDRVFVVDAFNRAIQIFSSDGQFLKKWGGVGWSDGQFEEPSGVALDAGGNVFVTDASRNRIQKFTADGQFLAGWGSFGSNPDQLDEPNGIVVDHNGTIYVADTNNNRITVFEPASQPPGAKAIVLAGGGPYEGNNLWNATQMVSNLAFRALRYQGFAKDQIRYLTYNTQQDLDDNGQFDDLDNATKSNLRTSITDWAEDSEKLLIYLTDHGKQGTFQINATEGEDSNLKAKELAWWLEELPATQVLIIYDACYAGSFIETIKGSGRTVITSTAPRELAQFGFSGSLSFSNYFWAQVFNGANFREAFTTAGQAVRFPGNQAVNPQTPQVDADGNGIPNEEQDKALLASLELLSQTQSYNKIPVIKSYAATPNPIPKGDNKATLRAEGVTDADGIQRVWAVIWSPNFSATGSNPITELPYVDLQLIVGTKHSYAASYEGFTSDGTYYVLIYAMDRQGNMSTPKLLKVITDSPRTHKAILVVGGTADGSWFKAVAGNTRLAYRALLAQSYAEEDIRVLSHEVIDETVPLYGAPTAAAVREAIQGWAAHGTQDLVLYLVGTGESGAFNLGASEKLYASELSAWLASIEAELPGNLIVVYDGCHSGSFIWALKGERRIVMASARADQSACLANNGVSSFSHFFWLQVLDGVNLRDGFQKAQKTMQLIGKNQAAQLDDDGDGASTALDGQLAKLHRIGPGFSLGSDPPLIQTACPDLTLTTGNKATIWVKDVTTTGSIKKVWAVVVPPDYQPDSSTTPGTGFPSFRLNRLAPGHYQYVYNKFTAAGQYLVTVFAADTEGNISQPKVIRVTRE